MYHASDFVKTYYNVSEEQKNMFAQEQKVFGKCPNCGKDVVNGKYGAYCVVKCGMNVKQGNGKGVDRGAGEKSACRKENPAQRTYQ